MIISPLKMREIAEQAYFAAEHGNLEAVKTLVARNFNLEDCDQHGNSILHYAVLGKNMDVIRFLVEAGGMDPLWSNHAMVTPFELAKETGQKEIEQYFETICGFKLSEAYKNPIRKGMFPDPSIVRVGEDYYMVNSTFIYFPCIPISHSRDLVHWELIGHAVTDEKWAEENLGPLQGGRGFWAPDISYHNGRFYICATLRKNDDAPYIQVQMVTSSERPEGPYETPVLHNVRGIDPSIFTDEDGRRYMLVNRGAQLMEISEDGKQILSSPELIWYGSNKHAPEGPHLLKKDGYYYCFMAEGGTGKGHMITVARSKSLKGPYEDCPYNPIMHQKDSASILQCCGHGKPVETQDGRWFIVYLCSRFLEDQWGMLGRETCLDEIIWTSDGWPLIHQGKGPSYLEKAPLPSVDVTWKEPWMAPRSIHSDRIRIYENRVELTGDGTDLCEIENRSILVKRQPDFTFKTEFEVDCRDLADAHDAGVTLYYDENTYIKFGIAKDHVLVTEYMDDHYVRNVKKRIHSLGIHRMKIDTDGLKRTFYFDGEQVAEFDSVTSICSEGLIKGKRFTSAMYGIYVHGNETVCFKEIL